MQLTYRSCIASLLLMLIMLAAPPLQAGGAAPPITVPFDHLTTGFELDGLHRDLPCEACHLNAIFKGTPRDCATCHSSGTRYIATPKPQSHIASSDNCVACHDTDSFRPEVHFDHAEILGSCVGCHNGTIAQGEGPAHPATSQNCAACHGVVSWNPPTTVDHSQIPLAVAGFCIICHNGVQAAGKTPNHIATTLECGDCHLTTTWASATFDHTGITSGCYSCHNGVKAVGKQGSHMPTSNVCEDCHTTGIGTSTPSWVPSAFEHTQMAVQTCQTCHNGTVKISTGVVSGQPANHVPPIPSLVDCAVCHGNVPSAETWTVLLASIPTLHAGLSVNNCLMCHAGQTFAGVPSPYIPMSMSGVSPTHATPLAPPHIPVLAGTDCSACHGAAYQSGGFGPATAMSAAKHAFVSGTCDTCHDTGRSFYVGSGTPLQLRPADHLTSADTRMASSDCSVCHETTDWVSNVMPAGHMPNPSNLGCNQCHTAAPSDYTPVTLAPIATLHTGIAGNCGLCHGAAAVLTWFSNYTPTDAVLTPAHVPYTSGTDCSACHAANYITGGFGPTAMNAAKHAFVPTACDTCHEAGLSFYMGAATPALQGRPADHLAGGTPQQATGDCSLCHETTDWNTNVLPAGHIPNPANQACSVCHVAIGSTAASYATLASVAVLHTGISSGCAQCHGATAPLTFYNNNDNPLSAVLSPAHITFLTGTDCSACHAANYVTGGFGPTNMSAAKHAFVPATCDTCHEAGRTFYLGASTPALQGRPADHLAGGTPQQATGDCSLCHETTDWNTTNLPAGHMPNPGNQACAVCHIAITGSTASYATLASNAVLHTGISSGCAQCHGATLALTFYNNNDNPKSAVLSPVHIPAFAGTDCSNCHVTSTYAVGAFGPMNMTQATHSALGSSCNGCHEAGLSVYMGAANPGLQGRPADHNTGQMLAPNDCSLCHTTANWNSTALPAGHMPNPANQACTLCHTTAPADYSTATLAANPLLHTGITASECAQCHGGTTALTWFNNFTPKDAVLTPAHIPYLAGSSCGSCHATTSYAAGSFGPMNMTQATHSLVVTTCNTCHEAGLSFYMGAANPGLQGRPADHNAGQMLAPNDCSICHTTANWNSTALPAGHMPNPANQNCTVCHKSAPADYSTSTLATNAVLHTGITSGCITCHGAPNVAAPVFYNNYTPKDALLSPVHIPTASTPCEDCHSSAVFTAFSGTTMTSAKHASMFAYIGKTCDACHNRVTPALSFYGVGNLTTRPTDHTGNKATADCSNCHSPNDWGGNVATRAAVAKSSTKGIVTSVVAGAANPARFAPLAGGLPALRPSQPVSHAGVTSNCVSCHNGVLAAGIGPAHIHAGTQCQDCHTTLAWLPARFDHRAITASCTGCHNGVTAPGMPTQHVVTHADCGTCHGTISWQPAQFNHLDVVAPCASCHNGTLATGQQAQHPATSADCGTCHNTLTWSLVTRKGPLAPLLRKNGAAPGR
jgi:hypothetical protein